MAQNPADYSVILTTVGLADLERSAIALSRSLEADGARAQASLIRQAYIALLRDLEAIGRDTAAKATTYIRDAERDSRVRPDTGGDGGPRLGDYVGESHALTAVEGSVGINFEPALYANVPWWWTNEEGYSGHIGREINGYFYDIGFTGATRPDPDMSGQHPLFAPGKSGDGPRGGKGGRGTIKEPIPDRRFVREGAEQAKAEWHARVQRARRNFIDARRRATLAAPPPRRRRGTGARRKA